MTGVLVDTSIWSLDLRRNNAPPDARVGELHDLDGEGRIVTIGPIRQEVLSGVRSLEQFLRIRNRLREFPDLPIESRDYERAAEMYNACRAGGIQGSHPDFLICAVAERRRIAVFTSDDDFPRYARFIPLRLHAVRPQA